MPDANAAPPSATQAEGSSSQTAPSAEPAAPAMSATSSNAEEGAQAKTRREKKRQSPKPHPKLRSKKRSEAEARRANPSGGAARPTTIGVRVRRPLDGLNQSRERRPCERPGSSADENDASPGLILARTLIATEAYFPARPTI